jgi:ADP-dependent NAD(P)H-hydrate dehydratase / NAD(P)H-hydrate epimerase
VPGTENLYTAEQTRALDRGAIVDHGIPGITLMSRAAQTAYRYLEEMWPDPTGLQVLCGTGNNGGDGFLMADIAHKKGIPVTVYQLGDAEKISGDAQLARKQALSNGVRILPYQAGILVEEGVIVDAMLGTGLGGTVRQEYLDAINAVNDSDVPVLAVDVPSGLCADTGQILGGAVKADLTVSFIGLNRGLFSLQGPDCVGALQFSDLGVPLEVYQSVATSVGRIELESALDMLPERPAHAHKGLYGSVLVVGGDYGMAGAASMAAEAALRCGAGLVRVATRPEHCPAIIARTPEVMTAAIESGDDLEAHVASADIIVVGPGLGQGEWSRFILRFVLDSNKPLIVDADALNLIASEGFGEGLAQGLQRENWVLTPHPGEAARLLGVSNAHIQVDRFASAQKLQEKYGGTVILKGNGTLVASAGGTLLSDYGNPGMASGGMGDVLSGVLGGLAAQGLSLPDSAALGVCLHGAAADIAAQEEGQRGLMATDLMPHLRALLG